MPKLDRARTKTDKRLKQMEQRMSRVYGNSSALNAVQKQFVEYMKKVKKETQDQYDAYMNAQEDKEKIKEGYIKAVKDRTIFSKEYKKLLSKLVGVLAEVNQQALDIANDEMIAIYTDNYNQVAEDCRKVGIKVNGRKKQS